MLQLARLVPILIAFAVCAAAPLQRAIAADPAPRGAPVGAGDLAPDFTLLDQDGRAHTLSRELATRDAVVLIFYRGHW